MNKRRKTTLLNSRFKKILLAGILGWGIYLIGSIVDGIFAGSMLGAEALAAVEVVAPFSTFIYFISSLFNFGLSIKYQQFKGEGNDKRANEIFGLGFILNLFSAVLVSSIMFIFKEQFLGLFNLSDAVYQATSDYYFWYIIIAFGEPLYSFFYSMASSDGEITYLLCADFANSFLNFGLSLILIRTMGDINALGIGTLCGVLGASVFVSLHYFSKKNSLKLRLKFSFKEAFEVIKLGSGSWLEGLCVAILDIIMNLFICRKFGELTLTSYAVVNLCINLTQFFMCAVGASTPLITQGVGAKNITDIKDSLKLGKKWIALLCSFSTILIGGLCYFLPNIYGLEPGSIYFTYSWVAALLISLTFNGYGWCSLIGGFYSSYSKPKYAAISSTLLQLVLPLLFCIPLSYIPSLGFYGLILGFTLTPIAGLIILVCIIKKKEGKVFNIIQYDDVQFSFDSELNEEFIKNTLESLKSKLEELNIKHDVILHSYIALDDALNKILEVNKEKRRTLCRISVLISDKCIKFIIKDDGKLFNFGEAIKDENDVSLTVLRTLTKKKEKYFINNLILSLNTNTFTIKNLGETK